MQIKRRFDERLWNEITKYTSDDLKTMQGWTLERKIQVTQLRIMEWYERWEGKVRVGFSGGKDSTVLLDLARRCCPDILAVFADTGLEYPEIRKFVKTKENVAWVRPKMSFPEVVKKYGWNYPGKEVALYLWYARNSKGKRQTYINYLNGLNIDGTENNFRQRYKKFSGLLDAPFTFSDKCCKIMKESVLDNYDKENGTKPILGIMASESARRKDAWLKTGCNSFDDKKPISKPMSFWTDQDVLKYLKDFSISYSSIYGEIVEGENGKLTTTGESRTGCMFCPVGCHLDKTPNKFQRMKISHPRQWEYCIRGGELDEHGVWQPDKDGLGLGHLLDYIGVPYE